jgi:hypothetical protein
MPISGTFLDTHWKIIKAMLYSLVDAFILNLGLFAGHLTHCKSFLSAESCLVKRNSWSNTFFIVNGDFSVNFIALNQPGGVSK